MISRWFKTKKTQQNWHASASTHDGLHRTACLLGRSASRHPEPGSLGWSVHRHLAPVPVPALRPRCWWWLVRSLRHPQARWGRHLSHARPRRRGQVPGPTLSRSSRRSLRQTHHRRWIGPGWGREGDRLLVAPLSLLAEQLLRRPENSLHFM